MNARNRVLALAATAFLLSNLAAGFAAGSSHYPLTVVLWEDSAELKTAGQKLTVWAQVFSGEAPTNATNVTFRWGLQFPPLFYSVATNGTYAGSPGRYFANVTVTASDESNGFGLLEVTVRGGADTATNSRIVYLGASIFPNPPGPAAGWTVAAGVDNYGELGSTLEPGESVVWSIDTAQDGTPTNASNLSVRLFEAPEVNFSETPQNLTPTWVSTGHYTATTQIPASQVESVQYILQATINEGNFASVDATADVWFYDTVVDFAALSAAALTGTLTVGDGTATQSNVVAALELTATADSHHIAWINGTTDASGKISFDVVNDGSTVIEVHGWMNGSYSQWVSAVVRLPSAFTPPSATGRPLDAVPLDDPGKLLWDRSQTIRYAFYQNGTPWANRTVFAFVSSARGIHTTANLTTDANGTAALSIDFSRVLPVTEDYFFHMAQIFEQGVNLTFRAAVGADNSSSDRSWWGEDEERAWPEIVPGLVRGLIETNLTFTTQPMSLGASFGVGAKYVGAKNFTGFKGAAFVVPTSINALFDGATERYAVWTGSGDPMFSYLVDGNAQEYFGRVWVPPYWPNTTYTLIGAVVPSFSLLGGGLPPEGAMNWISIRPGEALSEFLPSPDTTPPEIWGPNDFTAPDYLVDLVAHVYDNSLDFGTVGTVVWQFDDGSGPQSFTGETGAWDFSTLGNYTVTITATDGSGNSANHTFVVTILDRRPPLVTAGSDFTALGGVGAQFQGNASDDDPAFASTATFTWSFTYNASVVNLTGLGPAFTFWVLGAYDVTLTATDRAGNNASDTVRVTVVSPDTTAPTVDAGTDRTVDAGTVAAFTGSATDNDPAFPLGATCNWSFTYNGSAEQFDATGFSFTFWSLGTLDLTFACVDFWGNAAQDTLQVTVQKPDRVAPTVDAGPDASVETGDTVALVGLANDNDPNFPLVASFAWTFTYNASLQNLSGQNASFAFWVPGTYTVTFRVVDGWGNAASDTMVVAVAPPDTTAPTIPGFVDVTVAPGALLTLTPGISISDDDPSFPATGNITWTFAYNGSAVVRYGDAFAFAFAIEGDYTVTVGARDAAGNSATPRTFVVHVVRPDTTPPTVTAMANAHSVRAGSTVTFTGAATDGGVAIDAPGAFMWSLTYNGTTVGRTGLSWQFTFEIEGNYTITLTVRDSAGNVGAGTVNVTVLPPTSGTPAEGGLPWIPLLLVVVAAAAVLAFLRMRPKALGGDALPDDKEAKEGSEETRPRGADKDDKPSEKEDEKDLDDLLK